MENNREERVVYLKDLLFTALYKWKTALVLAVILAVILGGFKGISSYTSMKNEEMQIENSAQQELALEVYETRKANLQQQIDANLANARQQQKYLEESLLMNLDAFNYYEVYLSVFVETDYQIMPGMTYQNPDPTNAIIRAYIESFTNETSAEILADAIGIEPEYVLELLIVDSHYDASGFRVHLKVPDKMSGERLLECLKQLNKQYQSKISQIIAPHETHIKEEFTRQTISPALVQQQQEQVNKLTELNDNITNLQQKKNDLQRPKTIVTSGGSVVKDAAIFVVVGCILGVVIAVMLAWMSHLFGGKIYSGRVLTNRTGIKILGALNTGTVTNPIDKRLLVWEGRDLSDPSAQAALLALSIRNLCRGITKLLLTGNADSEELCQALAQAMPEVKILKAGDILTDTAALEALAECEAAVLIEQCQVSRYQDVARRMELINDHSKHLLGCVLLGD